MCSASSLRTFQLTSDVRFLLILTTHTTAPCQQRWTFFKSVIKSTWRLATLRDMAKQMSPTCWHLSPSTIVASPGRSWRQSVLSIRTSKPTRGNFRRTRSQLPNLDRSIRKALRHHVRGDLWKPELSQDEVNRFSAQTLLLLCRNSEVKLHLYLPKRVYVLLESETFGWSACNVRHRDADMKSRNEECVINNA